MITVRKSHDRGVGRHGWLTSHHTFSFAGYYDPEQMGFRTLRVINEDVVAPGRGFGEHHHDDMEIISIVMEGALAHRDSSGGEGVLRRGEVQRMSAGTGVAHSEYNASETDPVHFFQIWILPERRGIAPGYEQKAFAEEEMRGRLRLLVAPEGGEGALSIHQDARLFSAILSPGEEVEHALGRDRGAWIQTARGIVTVNGTVLSEGDGAAIEGESRLSIAAAGRDPAEILLFDLV
ncbi:MAG TPA: pirin family protein [Thermoanaerobaculia bacterium]|nr:pirin family protein [Thermoanaerobaculia bacterium]